LVLSCEGASAALLKYIEEAEWPMEEDECRGIRFGLVFVGRLFKENFNVEEN
jgi:hypothetical protein